MSNAEMIRRPADTDFTESGSDALCRQRRTCLVAEDIASEETSPRSVFTNTITTRYMILMN